MSGMGEAVSILIPSVESAMRIHRIKDRQETLEKVMLLARKVIRLRREKQKREQELNK